MQTAEILGEHGIEATVINARFAKPLDTELILPIARQMRRVVLNQDEITALMTLKLGLPDL